MKKIKQFWKKLKYWQKGGIIGLIIGIFFAITGGVGTLKCGLNPGHWEPPSGICKITYLWLGLYLPLLGSIYLTWFLLGWADNIIHYQGFITNAIFLLVIPSIILILVLVGIGVLTGFLIERRHNAK